MSQDSINDCPFCDPNQSYRYIRELSLVRAVYPKSPACNYHVLLMPKRHVQTLDSLTSQEVADLFGLLAEVVEVGRKHIQGFVGYNVLSNNGSEAVNQRVKHCHVHVFLRSSQESDDPLIGKSHDPQPLSSQQLEKMKELQAWITEK